MWRPIWIRTAMSTPMPRAAMTIGWQIRRRQAAAACFKTSANSPWRQLTCLRRRRTATVLTWVGPGTNSSSLKICWVWASPVGWRISANIRRFRRVRASRPVGGAKNMEGRVYTREWGGAFYLIAILIWCGTCPRVGSFIWWKHEQITGLICGLLLLYLQYIKWKFGKKQKRNNRKIYRCITSFILFLNSIIGKK